MKNTFIKVISISLMIVNSGYLQASDHPRIRVLQPAFQARLQRESDQYQSKLNILLARCEDKAINNDQRRKAIENTIDSAALAQKRRDARRAEAETKASAARAAALLRKRQTITQELRLNRQLALHTHGMAPIIPGINSHDPIPPAPAMPAETLTPAGGDSKVAFEHLPKPRKTIRFADAQATKYRSAMRAGLSPDMSIPEDLIPPSFLDQRLLEKSARRAALQKFELKPAAEAIAVGIIPATHASCITIPKPTPRTRKTATLIQPSASKATDSRDDDAPRIKTKDRFYPAIPLTAKERTIYTHYCRQGGGTRIAQDLGGITGKLAALLATWNLIDKAKLNFTKNGTPYRNCTAIAASERPKRKPRKYPCQFCHRVFANEAAFIADHFPK